MSNKKKILESKEIIYSLAQLATKKIYENKFLNEEIELTKNSIKLIKDFLIKYSSLNNKANFKQKIVDGINNIYNSLKNSKEKLLNEKSKYNNKLNNFESEIFDEKISERQNLKLLKIDNFILLSELSEKNDEIMRLLSLNKEISSSYSNLFFIEKFEKKISNEYGCNYLYNTLDTQSKELMQQSLYYNLYYKHCLEENQKISKLQKKINYYNKIISFIKNHIKEGKLYVEDLNININNNNEIITSEQIIKNKINNSQNDTNKKLPKKNKINLLTVSQLFDINNDEGKSEAIIDYELHSDDEVVFEKKIKPIKQIAKGSNLIEIKKKIPKIDLSMIEFNKQKVMNEADLYSLQRRQFLSKNIDEQIKEMTSKRKEMLHKCKTNIKKIIAMRKFSEDIQKKYTLLKPLKLKSSVLVGITPKQELDMEDKNDILEEIKESENDEEIDETIMNEKINYTQRDIIKKIKQRKSMKNVKGNNIFIGKIEKNNFVKIKKDKIIKDKKRSKIKRANSK